MSKFSKSIASYTDVKQVFDQALLRGKVTLRFQDKARATTFSGRAHAYRCLIREQEAAAGREFASPYDHLLVRRQPDRCLIIIEPRGFEFEAFTEDGEKIELDKRTADAPAPTPHERTLGEKAQTVSAGESSFLDSFLKGLD